MNKVSIIVPIYNKELFLANCIDSIKGQTYKNIEVLLIDDGSTDNSKILAEKIIRDDKRFKLINKANEGVSSARNVGIVHSTGDYLVFVDPDDWIASNLIERLLSVAIKKNADIVSCCAYVFLENKKIINSFFKQKNYEKINKERVIAQLLSNNYYNDAEKFINIGVPWGKIYKSDLIKKNNLLFKKNLRRNQDNIFNLYAFQYAKDFIYIDEPLYYYRLDNYNNVFNKVVEDAPKLFTDLAIETYEFIFKFHRNNKLLNELCYSNLYEKLLMILHTNILNPDYIETKSNKIGLLKKLCKSYPFAQVFKVHKVNYINKKQKIIYWSIKKEKYNLVFFLVNLQSKIRKLINMYGRI